MVPFNYIKITGSQLIKYYEFITFEIVPVIQEKSYWDDRFREWVVWVYCAKLHKQTSLQPHEYEIMAEPLTENQRQLLELFTEMHHLKHPL